MKTFKRILLICAAALVFSSCADNKIPRAIMIPPMAPRVEEVTKQAKVATVQAEKTVELAKAIKEKYKDDPAVAAVEESSRLTAIESKKTEFQAEFLKEYAKSSDLKVEELFKVSEKQVEMIQEKEDKNKKLEKTVIEQKAKITSKNGYLMGAGSIIFVLLILVIKPWRYL